MYVYAIYSCKLFHFFLLSCLFFLFPLSNLLVLVLIICFYLFNDNNKQKNTQEQSHYTVYIVSSDDILYKQKF